MDFEMILSGPCAYVPNRLTTDNDPATSWSLILPQLRRGGSANEVELHPHFSALQFPTDLFEADPEPDLRYKFAGQPEQSMIFLAGHQVRIQTTNPVPFVPELLELDQQILGSGIPVTDDQRVSLDWVPCLEELLPGAGTFGRMDEQFFAGPQGLPVGGNLAAHVILDRGRLVTDSLVPVGGTVAGIWGFQTFPGRPFVARQATACTTALRISPLEGGLKIRMTDGGMERVVSLREGVSVETARVELKNRELDEAFGLADGDIRDGDLDTDFKILYVFSGRERDVCPIPKLDGSAGLGTRRTTCGGGRFVGFSPMVGDLLTRWGVR